MKIYKVFCSSGLQNRIDRWNATLIAEAVYL
jgi:hypothetical protein